MKDGFSSTPEADLATALLFLQKQIREPVSFSYFSKVYLPFYLVHALPGRSLIISGVGEPTISVRHSSIPSLVQMRAELRNIEKIELVPKLLGEFIEGFEKPPSELVVIRNAMLPTMIDTLRELERFYHRDYLQRKFMMWGFCFEMSELNSMRILPS